MEPSRPRRPISRLPVAKLRPARPGAVGVSHQLRSPWALAVFLLGSLSMVAMNSVVPGLVGQAFEAVTGDADDARRVLTTIAVLLTVVVVARSGFTRGPAASPGPLMAGVGRIRPPGDCSIKAVSCGAWFLVYGPEGWGFESLRARFAIKVLTSGNASQGLRCFLKCGAISHDVGA